MSDRMSDPTEVLRNVRELLDCARHRGDQKRQAYLTDIIHQIETIWGEQGGKP